jgi:hypothetical protein
MRILRLSKLTTVRQGLSSGGDYACFVFEPGQNIHLPLSKEKASGPRNGVNVWFWSALTLTLNQAGPERGMGILPPIFAGLCAQVIATIQIMFMN